MSTLQIGKNNAGTVNSGDTVIFDETIENTGGIAYNNATGIITISENGTYVANWWVSTQSSLSPNIIFTLNSSSGASIRGNSPIKTGNTGGIAILEVTSAPITLSLQNTSADTVYFSSTVPVKASLMIFSIITASADVSECFERNQLVNVLTQIVNLYPGADITLYGIQIGGIPGQVQSLYTAPGSSLAGLFVTSSDPQGLFYFNINDITAFELTNSSYNNTITYLPLPDSFVENCETIMIPTIYNSLNIGETRTFLVANNYEITGRIYLNEYGMLVLAPESGANPAFIVPTKLGFYY